MSRILLIEADPAERLVLRSRVQDHGHEVVVTENGARGLTEARRGGIDLILLASRLGGGVDSAEVCRRLKAAPRIQTVPLIVYSQEAPSAPCAERMFDAGCEQFVGKAQMPLLERVVEVQLRLKARNDELGEQARLLEMENRRIEEGHRRDLDAGPAGAAAGQASPLEASVPDGILVVDESGCVVYSDRGACALMGTAPLGQRLGRLAPASGLEAFARDARTATRVGFRFDLTSRPGAVRRSLLASVVPLSSSQSDGVAALRLVFLHDAGRRRFADEMLSTGANGLPRQQLGSLLEAARTTYLPAAIVGRSRAASDLRATIGDAASHEGDVLLEGEIGTGKELAARILHYSSSRPGSYLELRCGALSESALEVELFGCVKGARPDIVADRPGLLLLAQDGTLFLDEVGELPLSIQQRLLDVLLGGSLRRLGSSRRERVGCRIVSSSRNPIAARVSAGTFLAELHRRLAGVSVRFPALRERIEDAPDLAQLFLQRHGVRFGVESISEDALWVCVQYSWPRNVEELEEALEQACRRATQGIVEVRHLPRALRDLAAELPRRELIPAVRGDSGGLASRGSGVHAVSSHPGASGDLPTLASVRRTRPAWQIGDDDPISLEHYEKKALLRALDRCEGDKLAAARLLQVGKSTLYRKLKKFGIG